MPRTKKTTTPSLLDQIAEAAKAGDQATILRLSAQLDTQPTTKKVTRRVTKKKVTPTKTVAKAKPKTNSSQRTRPDLEITDDESSYLAPSRLSDDYFGGRTFIGEDGQEHRFAKRVSMAGTKFVNKFKPTDYERLPANLDKFDKKQAKRKGKIPRPGERGGRAPAKKVQATCVYCRNAFMVYPWECEKVDKDTQFRCNDCIKKR